jgi:hypothetical protein
MIVEHFTAVGRGLATSAVSNLVESGPKRLEHFAVDHPCSRDKCWCIPSIAVIYVAMNMEKADSSKNFYRMGKCQIRIAFKTLLEILPELAH